MLIGCDIMGKWTKGGRLLFDVNMFGNRSGWGKVTSYDPFTNTGQIEINYKTEANGRVISVRTYSYKVKNLKIKNGNIVSLGHIVKDSGTLQKEVNYRFGGMSRLTNGFDTLMEELRLTGVSEDRIRYLTNMFDSLTTQDKIKFFNEYHQSYIVQTYSSDAIMEPDYPTDDNAYAETIQGILEEIVS